MYGLVAIYSADTAAHFSTCGLRVFCLHISFYIFLFFFLSFFNSLFLFFFSGPHFYLDPTNLVYIYFSMSYKSYNFTTTHTFHVTFSDYIVFNEYYY